MPRKKKEVEIVEEKKAVEEVIKAVYYGSGMTKINNMLQAGFKPDEVKKNE